MWDHPGVADASLSVQCGNSAGAEASVRRRSVCGVVCSASLTIAATVAPLASGTGAAGASTTADKPPANWIVQNDELANLRANGYTGTFQYTLCGGGTFGNPRLLPCLPGQTLDVTSYTALLLALRAGWRTPVLLDLEGWPYTPIQEYDNEPSYLCKAAFLMRSYRVPLIEAPVQVNTKIGQSWAAAARCGASAIELQIQWATRDPSKYLARTKYALSIIRPLNKWVPVIGGISVDPGGNPVTLSEISDTYLKARSLVSGFWLNLPVWLTGTGCAVTDGCVETAVQFLALVNGG
jgi:hypothetical protein